ncbi:hypothetical protein EDD21DRAFT_356691 [Dissophora ornata]|nr:hypothetical protein EDD21DRAFT_356691 [Dissophora ornata]
MARVGTPMAILDGVGLSTDSFTNWAQNVMCQPEATFYPNSLRDLQVIVGEASKENKKIRCAGSGHSWCTTSATEGYLALMRGMDKIHPPKKTIDGDWTVKIEMGVTVTELDQYLRTHNPPLALPSNVLVDDARYGGILTMGCHGASLNARTMSDLITEMAIVNAHGDLVTYSEEKDPAAFSAACLNLGLFGIIYTATLKVEAMDFRLRMKDAFPTLTSVFEGENAGLRLKAMVTHNDSTQIFHWPFKHFMKQDQNDRMWIKGWERTTDAAEAQDPNRPPELDNPFFSSFHVGETVLEVPDALHFHVGAGDTTVLDAGVAFKADGDFKNVIQSLKDLIDENWAFTTSMPERMGTLVEMRFVKSSSKIMSPAYDKDPEAIFCLINVMAVSTTPGFEDFSLGIVSNWLEKYNAKPHWAKLWEKVPNVMQYLREQYGERVSEFNRIRRTQDPHDMFVNDTWAPLLRDL